MAIDNKYEREPFKERANGASNVQCSYRFSKPLPMFDLKRPRHKHENIDMMIIITEYCICLYIWICIEYQNGKIVSTLIHSLTDSILVQKEKKTIEKERKIECDTLWLFAAFWAAYDPES